MCSEKNSPERRYPYADYLKLDFRSPVTPGKTDLLVSETFAGLKIDLSAIFPARPQTLSEPAPPTFE